MSESIHATLRDWTIHLTDLCGLDEVIDVPERKILIDPSRHGEEWMREHVRGHLTLMHTLGCGGRFSEEQEAEADCFAEIQLLEHVPIDLLT